MKTLIARLPCAFPTAVRALLLSAMLVAALPVVSGCGLSQAAFDREQAQYRQTVEGWKGRSESDLIDVWGYPTSTYAMQNGTKRLTYHYVVTTEGPSPRQSYTCDTIFELDRDGIVTTARYDGAAAFCREGKLAPPRR